jgi:hypothetical protein
MGVTERDTWSCRRSLSRLSIATSGKHFSVIILIITGVEGRRRVEIFDDIDDSVNIGLMIIMRLICMCR